MQKITGKEIEQKTRHFASRITIAYVILGALWILFSDRLIFIFFTDTHTLKQMSTYKGWFYVLLTGWLLYSLIKLEMKKRNKIEEQLKEAINMVEESEKLKTAFLNNISHEIRTPLNAILGFSELIINPDLNEEQKKSFSGFIKRGTSELLETIEDILIVSRIQKGQVDLELTSGDVTSLMAGMIEYYSAQLDLQKVKKDLEFFYRSVLKPEEGRITTDFRHLRQILSKLINNAVKFTDKGTIEICCEKNSANEILFVVRDTGCGIPAAKWDIVFNPFRQVNEVNLNRKTDGSGLGLSIAKGLVELLNGRIWFDSEVGKGSAFYFTIPAN